MLHEVGQLHGVCLRSRRQGFNSCIIDFQLPFEVALGAIFLFMNDTVDLNSLIIL